MKTAKESAVPSFKVVSRYLLGEAEEHHEKPPGLPVAGRRFEPETSHIQAWSLVGRSLSVGSVTHDNDVYFFHFFKNCRKHEFSMFFL
jgi:hypothetical protein